MALYRNKYLKRTHHIIILFKSNLTNSTSSVCIHNNLLHIQRKPICSNAKSNYTVETLISIFTRKPISLESAELQELSSKLTPWIVETVLKSFRNWRIAHMFFNWASRQVGYTHNCYTYNAMAMVLSNARQIAPLRVLAVNLLNSRCSLTAGALGYLIRCLGSQGLVKEANDLFDQVRLNGLCFPNSYSYSCLLEVISKHGDVRLMELRLNEMRDLGVQIDKYVLMPFLQCYCKARDVGKAMKVFGKMREMGWVDLHVVASLVVSVSKLGEVDMAFDLVEQMERDLNISLNEKTFHVLIHGFVGESRVDKALLLLDKMRKSGFVPDISIYDVLIEGMCKNKEIDKALELCMQMKESGISPDIKIISKILSCVPDESSMIQMLKEKQESLDDRKRMILFNSALTGLVNISSVDRAYHLLKATIGNETCTNFEADDLSFLLEDIHPDTTSFQVVIDGLCTDNKLDMALVLFRDMDRSKRSVLLYNNLIACLSNSDRLDECFHLLNEMKQSEFKPTYFTYNSIFGCLCRRQDVKRALDMLREMRMHGYPPWIKHCTLLVKKLCEQGKASDARHFLAEIVNIGFVPDMIAYSATIDGLVKIDELDQGLELFKEICRKGYFPDVVAYNVIINGLCKANRVVEVETIVDEMIVVGFVPSVVTYNSLIDGWCKHGDVSQATRCFSKMMKEKLEPNVITYTTLIDGLCNAGKPDDAIKLWIFMVEKGCVPNRIAYMAFINGLCKCGKSDDAVMYFREMEEKKMVPDSYIYEALVSALMSNSNRVMANEILEKMARHHTVANKAI